MACKITIDILSDKAIKALKAKSGKLTRSNNYLITTNLFGEEGKAIQEAYLGLFKATSTAQLYDIKHNFDPFFESADGKSAYRNDVVQKTSALFDPANNTRKVLQLLDPNKDKTLDQINSSVIAMKEILESIETETHLQKDMDIDPETLATINANGVSAPIARSAPTIGRKIAESKGELKSGNPISNQAYYTKLGEEAIQDLVDDKVLTLNDTASAQWLTSKGSKNMDGSSATSVQVSPTVAVNEGTFKAFNDGALNPGLNVVKDFTAKDMLAMVKQVDRLISPYSETPVSVDAVNEVFAAPGMHQSDRTIDVLKKVQNGAFVMASNLPPLLDQLAALYKENVGNEQALETVLIKRYGEGAVPMIENMFGVAVAEDTIFKYSDLGIKIGRLAPLIQLLQHYDLVKDQKEFFLTYKQAHNNRLFQRETMLNAQAGKKFDRQLLESSVAFNFKGAAEVDELVKRASEETGLHVDVITGDKEGTQMFEDLLESMVAEDYEDHLSIMFNLASDPTGAKTGIKKTDGWTGLKALHIVADIRKGYKDKNIDTKVLFESDANSSGPFLVTLQSAFLDKSKNLLGRLGMFGKSDNAIDGFYQLTTEKFAELKKLATDRKRSHTKSGVDTVEEIMRLTGNAGDFKSFIKDVVIRFTYSQTDEANKKEAGVLLSEQLIRRGSETVQAAYTALGIKHPKGNDSVYDGEFLTKIEQAEAHKLLAKELATKVGTFLVRDVLAPTLQEDLFSYNKDIRSDLFKLMQTLPTPTRDAGISAKFMNPTAVMEWVDEQIEKKTGLTIENFPYSKYRKDRLIADKKKEIVHRDINNKVSIYSMYDTNENSIHILPIHAMDATILLRAVEKVYKEHPELFGETTPAMLLVHDAIYMSPKLANAVEQAYDQEIMNVSVNYNIIHMMLMEAAFKYSSAMHTAALEQDPNAPFKEYTLEQLGAYDSRFNKFIEQNKIDREANNEILNVTPDGEPRQPGDTYRTADYMFSTDLTKDAVDKRNEAYDKRIEGNEGEVKADKKKKTKAKEEMPDNEVDNGKEIPIFTGTPDNTAILQMRDIIDQGKPYLVSDTEGTGTRPGDSSTVPHQIAYKEGKDGKTKVINLKIDDKHEITSDFAKFYLDLNPDIKYTKGNIKSRNTAIRKHINDKYESTKEVSAKNMVEYKELMLKMPAIFHNSGYDIGVLTKVEEMSEVLNDKGSMILDSLEMATYVKRNAIMEQVAKQGVKDVKYVKDVITQEALASSYNIKADGTAHTADVDVDVLTKILGAMVDEFKGNTTGYKQQGTPNSIVMDYTTNTRIPAENSDGISYVSAQTMAQDHLVEAFETEAYMMSKEDPAVQAAMLDVLIDETKCKTGGKK